MYGRPNFERRLPQHRSFGLLITPISGLTADPNDALTNFGAGGMVAPWQNTSLSRNT